MTNAADILSQHLTSTGISGGDQNLAVNGSVTPQKFFFAGPAADVRTPVIARMLFLVQDGGPFNADQFGGIAALTNGVRFVVEDEDETEIRDLLDGGAIQSNGEWAEYMYDTRLDGYGAGDDFIAGRWSFNRFAPGGLSLPSQQRLVMIVQDDLSALTNFSVVLQGYYAR